MKGVSMNNTIFDRQISKISDPIVHEGLNENHSARELIPLGNPLSTDPFLVLMEDRFPEGVFGDHPHRGLETVTYIIEGQIDHRDNKGNKGSFYTGDVQWMTAGRGIIHNEIPAKGSIVHSLQLWVNLPSANKMVESRVQTILSDQAPLRKELGVEVRIFSGRSGNVFSKTQNHVPVVMLEITMDTNHSFSEEIPSEFNGFVYILKGEAKFGENETLLQSGQLGWLTKSEEYLISRLKILTSDKPVKFLLIAGNPLKENVVQHGPFVMNTNEEIEQAYQDYRSGRFF